MKHRSPWAVLGFSIITLGIYTIYWLVVTNKELVQKGANIPTSLLVIIPYVSIYWMWKYCQGADHVSNGKMNHVTSFLLLFLTGAIGTAILQSQYNALAEASPIPQNPMPNQAPTQIPPAPQSDMPQPSLDPTTQPITPQTPTQETVSPRPVSAPSQDIQPSAPTAPNPTLTTTQDIQPPTPQNPNPETQQPTPPGSTNQKIQ